MPKTIIYDFVIVGAGPAGTTAAYLLQSNGFNVLLLDKKKFPRYKLCGGLLTAKTLTLLHRVFGDTFEDLQRKQIIDYSSHQFEVRTKDFQLYSGHSDLPFVFVDRQKYDNYLLDKVKNIGVKVLENENVVRVDPMNHKLFTASGKVFQGRYIIGADGVNSIVRSSIPNNIIDKDHWRENLAMGVEVFIQRKDIDENFTFPILYYGIIDWGYAWVFPNQDKIIVGVGGLVNQDGKITQSLESFLQLIGYKQNVKVKPRGHPVPYGNFIADASYGPVILLGDAAGLVDPVTGEGIFYAQRSAELFAAATQLTENQGGNLIDIYTQSVKEDIIRELNYAKKVRDYLFINAEKFGYKPLKPLFHFFGPKGLEAIHGSRSYKWFSKKEYDIPR